MSTIKVTNLRHESASSSNITLDSSNNVTTANNFTAGGTLGCTGDLTITSGNLVVSSGNGIDFSAAGNATGMSSELLDDYEEGTWTPAISNTGYTYTYSVQEGQYTKIGRLVTLRFRILVTARSGSASGGHAMINLPLTSDGALDGSSYAYAMPGELIVHKTSTTTTSGAITLLFGGLTHNNTSSFWVNNPTVTNGFPFDLGSDFNLGGVITYTA